MKKVVIGAVALFVILGGVIFFVWSSFDEIVKTAIETYGSEAIGTPVRVAEVNIRLESGEGSISGLRVGNPPGFRAANIFELGMIRTKINTDTVMQNPIVIDEIVIRSPTVFYEISKAGVSNVDVLKKNISRTDSGGAVKQGDGEELKMIIRKLVVEDGKVMVRIAALGKEEQTVTLPPIRLTDVGRKSGGVTAMEVAQILSGRLVKNVQGLVAVLGVKRFLGKPVDMVGEVGGALGGAAGKVGGAVGGALKGILGK
ncbi:MAG: hypothetical protein Q9M29_06805 [Mariprofundaceae bacterium]|nr:hypothetical protein [Mariprofundaceae bacterium]